MLQTIFDLIVTNWKTTATGLAVGLVWIAGQFGLDIPVETKEALTAFLVSLGLIFSKDGNKY